MENKNSEAIRDLNDRFRKGDAEVPGKWVFTAGIAALLRDNDVEVETLIGIVQAFDDFSADNDPFREHDFGMFQFLENKIFWKLDYYAPDMLHGSSDPTDTSKTVRVLTVLLAMEY